ncbi:MAG: class I SAM-dependent methyltransferase [Imperialibacter sp.]|uniref:class I SAM-dependent methyltransferase n=1 Tax=Imperialibacter sp. TaxID=2038411 RepID=UPI003A8650CF
MEGSSEKVKIMWNERYARTEFAYGKEPNDFLKGQIAEKGSGKVLCLAEGQGRNAVYLAGLGYEVTATDLSSVGLERTKELAKERDVAVATLQIDLGEYQIGSEAWDGIVCIFGHFPPSVRAHVLSQLHGSLKSGGFLLMEVYSTDQLDYGTGGPKETSMLYTLNELKTILGPSWDFKVLQQTEREINEGEYHNGNSSVIQVYARKK